MDWDTFFNNLSSFLLNISEKEEITDLNFAESVMINLQANIRVLYAIKNTLDRGSGGDMDLLEMSRAVTNLISDVEFIYHRWALLESGIQSTRCEAPFPATRVSSGLPGRPKVWIDQCKIEFLRELRFTWTDIAKVFGVCRRTLYNVRVSNGMLEVYPSFTSISDENLNHHVKEIKKDMPDIGYNMMRGVLQARGIYVSIPRIQKSISEVDPINTALRWASPISRRVYGVPYPNFVWHIDGNHKLIRLELL